MPATVTLSVEAAEPGTDWEGISRSFGLTNGLHNVVLPFAKPFAPYPVKATVACTEGEGRILSYRLIPGGARIYKDLEAWSRDGIRPAWLPSPAADGSKR